MHKDLLTHSPLLALPLFALVVFVAVFLVIVLRTLLRAKRDDARDAALPLHDDTPENRHARL